MKKFYRYCGVADVAVAIIALTLTGCGGSSAQFQREQGPTSKHALKGYENCFSCHSTGSGGAPKYPANHSGRTNDQCQICHDFK